MPMHVLHRPAQRTATRATFERLLVTYARAHTRSHAEGLSPPHVDEDLHPGTCLPRLHPSSTHLPHLHPSTSPPEPLAPHPPPCPTVRTHTHNTTSAHPYRTQRTHTSQTTVTGSLGASCTASHRGPAPAGWAGRATPCATVARTTSTRPSTTSCSPGSSASARRRPASSSRR